jgi:DNA helicase HerA-like ATPase
MTFSHPFVAERLMGVVHQIDGTSIEITLPRAASTVSSAFGERIALGEIGEFVVIDIGGLGIFGRLLEISTPQRDIQAVTPDGKHEMVNASGRIQLLSTLSLDGKYTRGVARHPRVGDHVYSASNDVLQAIVSGVSHADDGTADVMINMGTLSSGDGVPVSISASKLFGRHLAILGATGSGKSWTLAHLMEEVSGKKGKLLLIDATGEFHSLGKIARHVSLGLTADDPDQTTKVCLPHHEFSEADRNAFLRPSGGSQLPKLRAAIRSLRLAHALGTSHEIVDESGLIPRMGRLRKPIVAAERQFASTLEDPHAYFSLENLPMQIAQECIFDTNRDRPELFGGWAMNDIAYCNSLVARVHDMLQTDVIADVINANDKTPSVLSQIDTWLDDPGGEAIFRISLKNLAFSHFVREIVVNTVGRRLLGHARRGDYLQKPLIVAVDEAHQFFGKTIGDEFTAATLDAFDSIAKEGRKYGLTVCMATQRPGDLPTGVLSQAGMMLVHRLADKHDRDRVEQASSELDQSATKLLPSLIPGEALLVGADFPVPLPVRLAPPAHRPSSRGPDYGTWGTPPNAQGVEPGDMEEVPSL